MSNPEPIKLYTQAREAYQRGDKETATVKLANAVGLEKPNKIITGSIDRFMNLDSMPSDAILTLIAHEAGKRNG